MKSYLSMIPISAKLHKRQNRMTIWCIVIAVFLVTAVFSMTEMMVRQETARLINKHGIGEVAALFTSEAFFNILPLAVILFLFVLCAGVFMIAGSLNTGVAQRTHLFGMMRCIGMSRRQIIRYVRLEALNWCKTAIPVGLLAGTAATWALCAILKYVVGGEWATMPQMKISMLGVVSGALVGVLTVLLAARRPARRAAAVSPVAALSDVPQMQGTHTVQTGRMRIETRLGIRHAAESKKNLFLMIGSFALSIILFLSFSVIIDLVNCILPQSPTKADLTVYEENEWIEAGLLDELENAAGVERAFGRRVIFDAEASCADVPSLTAVDLISYGAFDLEAMKKDGTLKKSCDLAPVLDDGAALLLTEENIPNGSMVSLFGREIPIAGKLNYDPFSDDGTTGGKTTLIVSNECFRELTGISDYSMILIQLTDGAGDADVEKIGTLIGSHRWTDDREYDTRGTYLAFLVCVYGFLGVIALVTVLNIRNSISMSVSARTRQYGAMRAVGMSQKQVGRMIRAETLTYAALGCIVGTLIGILFGRWLYAVLVTAHYPFRVWHFPVWDLLVILAFFLLSFAAGIRAPIRRLKDLSVTETIGRA